MSIHLCLRITKAEKAIISKLAKSFSMSVSEYIKLKLFEHNFDHLDLDVKFSTPSGSKHKYFLALSQIKLILLFERLFEKQGLMKNSEFRELDKEVSEASRAMIEKLGYKKTKRDQDE